MTNLNILFYFDLLPQKLLAKLTHRTVCEPCPVVFVSSPFVLSFALIYAIYEIVIFILLSMSEVYSIVNTFPCWAGKS